tara:strand:- start:107 stop:475 length:369 start_codon:yes stop_codon:yes gene_type:complete
MSYTAMSNIQLCYNNDKAFIYRLIRVDGRYKHSTPEWEIIDLEIGACHLREDTEYIGLTSNPIKRSQFHKAKKDKNLIMQIFAIAGSPAHAKFLEAKAIFEYEEKYGTVPKYNIGGDSYAGA